MALGESPKFFFKKHYCVAACGGTLCLGKVTSNDHELFFEKDHEVSLSLKKLCEFKILLRILGKHFAFGSRTVAEEMQQTEISPSEIIYVKDKSFGKKINEKIIFEVEFDPFSYINFLFAIRDTCLFICHPSKAQYKAMISYHNAKATVMSDKIKEVCDEMEQSAMQRFMSEQFLCMYSPLVDFYSDVRALLEGRK